MLRIVQKLTSIVRKDYQNPGLMVMAIFPPAISIKLLWICKKNSIFADYMRLVKSLML